MEDFPKEDSEKKNKFHKELNRLKLMRKGVMKIKGVSSERGFNNRLQNLAR